MDNLFLTGTFNNWELRQQHCFQRHQDEIYSLLVDLEAGVHEFKVKGGSDQDESDFGADGSDSAVALNQLNHLGNGGAGLVLNVSQSGIYYFSLDFSHNQLHPTLRILAKYLRNLSEQASERFGFGLEHFLDTSLPVSFELGRAEMPIEEALTLGTGSIVELDTLEGEPINIYIGGNLVAIGEAVVTGDEFAVRVLEVLPSNQNSEGLAKL